MFRRGAISRWMVPLAAISVLLGVPTLARGQSSRVQTATVRFEGGVGGDGYVWATYSARYAFHACQGKVDVTIEFVRGSLQFSPSYILDGKQVDAPPGLAPSEDQASIAGDVRLRQSGKIVGSFTDTAATIAGHGCLSNTVPVANLRDHLGENPLPDKVREFIDSLELSVKTMPAYKNRHLESALRDKLERERRQADKKAAEEKVAEQKAAEQKVAQQKATERKPSDGVPPAPIATGEAPSPKSPRAERPAERQQPPPAHVPTGTERWEQYQAQEAVRAERNRQVGDKLTADLAALGAQIGRRSAQEEAQEAREDARWIKAMEARMKDSRREWQEKCAARKTVVIPDPGFHVQGRTMFIPASRYCLNGEHNPSSHESRDSYTFQVSSAQRIRFLLAGQADTRVSVRRVGESQDLDAGRDFTASVKPGQYVVVVARYEAENSESLPDEPYYLRLLKEGTCWIDSAVPLVEGVNTGSWGNPRCLGAAGRRFVMYKLAMPSSPALRDLRFRLKSTGADLGIMALAGEEGRTPKVERMTTVDSVYLDVKNARRDTFFVLVASAATEANEDFELHVHSRTLPYRPHFRGDFTLGFGWQGGAGESAALLKMGFSLGMQIGRLFGIGAVIHGGVGRGQEPAKTDLGLDVHNSVLAVPALLGLGLHLGTPNAFVRLTPAVSVMRWGGDMRVGRALRLDAASPPFHPTGHWGMLPYLEVHSHSGVTSYAFGIDFIRKTASRVLPPDDQ